MADEKQAVAAGAGASPPPGEGTQGKGPDGGSGRLKAWIIIVTTVVYAGLVAGSSLFTQYVVTPSVSSRLIEKEKERIAEIESRGDGDIAPFGSVYVIEDLVVNPAGSAGMRYVCVSVGLESHSLEVIKELELRDAQVKDALITIFGSKSVDDLVDVGAREVMRGEIRDRIEKVLPPEGLDAVYFVNFVLQ
ncbi:MAG: flagellar basal body-associated FliL family protein [Candidatus Eisenbacteria bacterium]